MKRILKTQIVLFTPLGKKLAPLQIVYSDGETSKSEITIIYDGAEYKGFGTDYLWTDTLADLEIKLPKDVKIGCCTTCRHGNMCPYGQSENELFCTKELKINDKEDMCNLFDQTNPIEERSVASFDYCEDFARQSDEYYTYNDYLYQLSKKRRGRHQ